MILNSGFHSAWDRYGKDSSFSSPTRQLSQKFVPRRIRQLVAPSTMPYVWVISKDAVIERLVVPSLSKQRFWELENRFTTVILVFGKPSSLLNLGDLGSNVKARRRRLVLLSSLLHMYKLPAWRCWLSIEICEKVIDLGFGSREIFTIH